MIGLNIAVAPFDTVCHDIFLDTLCTNVQIADIGNLWIDRMFEEYAWAAGAELRLALRAQCRSVLYLRIDALCFC